MCWRFQTKAKGLEPVSAFSLSDPRWFIPWVTSAPCQVLTEPAGACPVGASRSEITPLEIKPAGLEDADLYRQLWNQGLSFNTAKIQQKIPETSQVSSLCVTLTQRGYGNLFIVMRRTAAGLWSQFTFNTGNDSWCIIILQRSSIWDCRSLFSYFTRIPRNRRGLVMEAAISQ